MAAADDRPAELMLLSKWSGGNCVAVADRCSLLGRRGEVTSSLSDAEKLKEMKKRRRELTLVLTHYRRDGSRG